MLLTPRRSRGLRIAGIHWGIMRPLDLPDRIVTLNRMRAFLFVTLLVACSSTESPMLEAGDTDSGATGGVAPVQSTGGRATGGRRATGGARASSGIRATGGADGTGGAPTTGGASTNGGAGGADVTDSGRSDSAAMGGTTQDAMASGGASAVDAGPDAPICEPPTCAPPCECSSGPCCDGCHFRPATTRCGSRLVDSWCSPVVLGALCAYRSPQVLENWIDRFCRGDSSECNGDDDTRISAGQRACPTDTFCHGSTLPGDAGPAPTCGPCL